MIDFVGKSAKEDIDAAIARMLTVEHFAVGSIISMPIMYPSGSNVSLEVMVQGNDCFISDRSGGFLECELFGSTRYFKSEAEKIAARAGIGFDGRDMFIARVPKSALQGAMTVVANSSATAAQFASRKQSERSETDIKDELFERLARIFKNRDVAKDVEAIGTSNHKWKVSVMVADSGRRSFFEPVSNAYVSVVGTSAKFHDFANIGETRPHLFSVIRSRQEIGDYFGVISNASDKVITMNSTDKAFSDLLEAA